MRINAVLLLSIALTAGCASATVTNPPPPRVTEDGEEMLPCDLLISGTNVFARGTNVHEIMKDVFVVVKELHPTDMRYSGWQGEFTGGQKIEWGPVVGTLDFYDHRFKGVWKARSDGKVDISGRYEPTGHGTFPKQLESKGAYVVSTVLLRKGYPPYTHTVELWIEATDEKASNHTSDGIRQPADGLPKPSR